MTDNNETALAVDSAAYPRLARALEKLNDAGGALLMGQIRRIHQRHGHAFRDFAEHLLTVIEPLPGDPVQALLEYTVTYLKEQARFVKTGAYSHTDFEAVRREVYDNPEVMESFYLLGLLITHAFWLIHFEIHCFFREAFLARLPAGSTGIEIGFGHGLYLLEILRHDPGATVRGIDISNYSLQFATRLLESNTNDPSRWKLGLGDIRNGLSLEPARMDWAVFAEVLEHIPTPEKALPEIARVLKPGGLLFATTVIDSNACDHITQFESTEQVRAMLRASGFGILNESILAVAELIPGSRDRTVDLAFVCERIDTGRADGS